MLLDRLTAPSTVEGRMRLSFPARRARVGFTLVELLASVALLIILLTVLFVVFGQASQTVSIGKARIEVYRTVRAVFRLMEQDITSAFLITDRTVVPAVTHGLLGEDGTDGWFLYRDADNDGAYDSGEELPPSDRLTLVLPRRGYDPSDSKPGFVNVCYLRVNGLSSMPGRLNLILRAMDEEEDVKPGSRLGTGSDWEVGDVLPLDFPLPDLPTDAAAYQAYFNTHANFFQNYLLALNVSDLQFRYLPVGGSAWQDSFDSDSVNSLPAAVEITIRLGRATSQNVDDHDTFTHTVFLPTAP